MKKLTIFFLFLFPFLASFSQGFPNNQSISNPITLYHAKGGLTADVGFVNTRYPDTLASNITDPVIAANLIRIAGMPGSKIVVGDTEYLRDSTATRWLISSASGITIPAGAITTIPVVGTNPGTNLPIDEWINNTFYGSQPPTATLTGGTTLELQSAATLNYTLDWSAGRQSATEPLATIVVAGNNESFSQPAAGSSVSGTQAVSFAANTNITYSNIVTTTDGKSATATTTFTFLPRRYYGWIDVGDTSGIGSSGYDDSKITSLGNELSVSKSKTWTTGNPTGTQIYVYAYYATAGELNNLILNGFPSIDAFNHVTRNLTNSLGYTGQWIIYWNRNGQTLSSDIIAN